MNKTIIVSALVSVVILTECLFAYLMIPSSTDVEAWAKGQHGEAAGHGEGGEATPRDTHAETEVDLGKFNVIVHEPSSQVTIRVNFHLIGTVREEEHTEFEELL